MKILVLQTVQYVHAQHHKIIADYISVHETGLAKMSYAYIYPIQQP